MPREAQIQVLLWIFQMPPPVVFSGISARSSLHGAKSFTDEATNLPTASPISLPLRLSLGSCCSWAGLALPPRTCIPALSVSRGCCSLLDQPPVPLHLAVTQHFSLTGN